MTPWSRKTPRTVLTALALAAGASACGTLSPDPNEPFPVRQIQVVVRNLNPDDVTIHRYRNRSRRRVGSVGGGQTRRFTLEWDRPGPIHFEADLFQGRRCLTQTLPVDPGETLEVRIGFAARVQPDGAERLCNVTRQR